MDQIRTVYFDESGFTGPNLRDHDQPVFVYAGLMIEPVEAAAYLQRWTSKFSIPLGKNDEVKGSSLMTSKNPTRLTAVTELIDDLGSEAWIAIFEKPFALAGKFFEYTLDPILFPKIGLFHALRFPQFVANLLAVSARADGQVESMLADFMQFVNKGDAAFTAGTAAEFDLNNPLDCIRSILARHRSTVLEHVSDARQLDFGSWILDLTSTALFTLLMQMGDEVPLRVVVDESKPLAANMNIFNKMVDMERGGPEFVQNGMRMGRFSLSESLIPRKSHLEPGLQLADVIAAAAGKIARDGAVKREKLAEALDKSHQFWIQGDPLALDWSNASVRLNSALLFHLAERSVNGQDLFEDLEGFLLALGLSL
jgi:hypothetical protein